MRRTIIALSIVFLCAFASCIPAAQELDPAAQRMQEIEAIGYENIDFSVSRPKFLEEFRGAVRVDNEDEGIGVSYYAIQGVEDSTDVIGFQFLHDELMNLLISYRDDRIDQLGGAESLKINAINRFGPPTEQNDGSTIWSFPAIDRKIVAVLHEGMWTLSIQRISIAEQLQTMKSQLTATQIGQPPSSQTPEVEEPKEGWVYWEPTGSERAAMEAEAKSLVGQSKGRHAPTYRIVEQEDYSIAGGTRYSMSGRRRYSLKVRVEKPVSEQEIESICNDILATDRRYSSADALMLFFYLPGTDLRGHYTAGKATWGTWASSEAGSAGRKSLSVEAGNALGDRMDSYNSNSSLSLSKKRRIYYELVAAQDAGVGDERAYSVVAARHGIPADAARQIAVEGAIQGWPMP